MKTPSFWSRRNLTATLLSPLGCLYALATRINLALHKPHKVNTPVLCIGNLTAGGTGKTPTAVSIAKIMQQNNQNPHFVSRGYGGTLHNVIVDIQQHTPQQVGDEPLLLTRQAPTVVSPDRYFGAQIAENAGADIIIMDDGFQNPKLHKDLSFLVFDGGFGYGNGWCIPAGPLRESLSAGLKRADAIIIIGEDKHNLASKFNLPVFQGNIVPTTPEFEERKAIAFAGIGRPEKFYQSLRELNFELVETIDFPDHHYYSEPELNELITKAQEKSCILVTTAKDMVKIPAALRPKFKVLEIEVKWNNETELANFINQKLFTSIHS